jgi:predicted RNA binding protein YcfA (HicA-like mRNA interferase family)
MVFRSLNAREANAIYRHPDGRRVVIHYHRATDTLTPYVLRNLLAGTRWTEDDLRRLKLIK